MDNVTASTADDGGAVALDKTLARHVGQNVRNARNRKGYSQEKLAELCALDRGAISKIEKGQRLPHLMTVLKIIAVLEVTVEELLRGAPSWVAGAGGQWVRASHRKGSRESSAGLTDISGSAAGGQ